MHNTVTQGFFDPAPRPNTGTTSSIGEHVSEVGVPQNAQDLTTYEYQLVLHSIKQDLSAVLQRRANTPLNVDWEQLMHHEAPEEPRNILQGLVYVARIKDVANTRGGAQVSQHRRVLAQQTYNMLVQELSDVLQGQDVQRGLRDLSAGTEHHPLRKNTLDQAVQSNSATQGHTSQRTLSTLPANVGQGMRKSAVNTATLGASQNEDTMSMRSDASVARSIVREYIFDLDSIEVEMGQEMSKIAQKRVQDEEHTDAMIHTVKEQMKRDIAQTEKQELENKLSRLERISGLRTDFLASFDAEVEDKNQKIENLRARIRSITDPVGNKHSTSDCYELDFDIQAIKLDCRTIIKQTNDTLEEIREKESK